MSGTVSAIHALRTQIWSHGFRPLPVQNAVLNDPHSGKAPIGAKWTTAALEDPPQCLRLGAVAHALNTGVLCDGLRVIDLDIDDSDLSTRVIELAVDRLGETLTRTRPNSPRALLVYRAAVGAPPKLSITASAHTTENACKIEVLGRGQQFVAYGRHWSGSDLQWLAGGPADLDLAQCPAVTEEAIHAFLTAAAAIIGAPPPGHANGNGQDHTPGEAQADPLRIVAALATIPNLGPANWEDWNRVGMAVWRATGGAPIGFAAWDAWSSRHPSYNATAAAGRWSHYSTSPPTSIGAGTLFRMAQDARAVPLSEPAFTETPPDLGDEYWRSVFGDAGAALDHQPEPDPGQTFPASPLDWDAMLAVAPREWVYGHFLIRRFVSVLGAPGGTGKTAYAFAVALSIVTGVDFLGQTVHDPGNVWIYNLEDPKDELLRRIRATIQFYGVTRKDVENRLFLDSGRDRELVVAKATSDGGIVVSPIVKQIIAEIRARQVRVLIVDPFVRSHRLEENDNNQIDFAAALWGEVADQADCAILLVHHFHKGGLSGNATAFRGASALIDAARAAVSLAPMSTEEADRLGIPEQDRWRMVRLDNAKLNLAPPPDAAVWLRLVGEDIGNATRERPSDRVQTIERWEPPSVWDGLPWAAVIRVLDAIEAGPEPDEFYTVSRQGKDRWAGTILVDAGRTPGQAREILREWVASGVLIEGQYLSPKKRQTIGCVRVDPAKVQEMRRAINPSRSPEGD